MRGGIIWLVLTVCASGAAAQTSVSMPEGIAYAPPVAVDHVAVYVPDKVPNSSWDKQITLYRHGNQLREDRVTDVSWSHLYADLNTGLSWQLSGSADMPQPSSLRVSGASLASQVIATVTPRTDRWLNEDCTVWNILRKDIRYAQCLTSDGVMLWQEVYYTSGERMGRLEAVKVERKRITSAEIVPPSAHLSRSYWFPVSSKGTSTPNDEVILSRPDQSDFLVIRRYGTLSAEEETTKRGRNLKWTGSAYHAYLSLTASGALSALWIDRIKPQPHQGSPVPSEEPQHILDRQCTPHNETPNIQDYNLTQCRTEDGMVLSRRELQHGAPTYFTAVRIATGTISQSDVTPPETMFTLSPGPVPPFLKPQVRTEIDRQLMLNNPINGNTIKWAHFPDNAQLMAAYPARALEAEVEGQVTAECAFRANGGLSNCVISNEMPKNYGFAVVSLALLEKDARAEKGQFLNGQKVRVRLNWQLNPPVTQ